MPNHRLALRPPVWRGYTHSPPKPASTAPKTKTGTASAHLFEGQSRASIEAGIARSHAVMSASARRRGRPPGPMDHPPRKANTGAPANLGPQPINKAKFDSRLRELDELIAAEQAVHSHRSRRGDKSAEGATQQ